MYIQITEDKLTAYGEYAFKGHTKEVSLSYEEYSKNPDKWVFDGNDFVLNPNLEEIRKQDFKSQFFETCLGYIRRNVTMQDGTTKSFLTDLLPLMRVGIPIISYNLPDFSQEVTQENLESLQNKVFVTEQFITECQNQVIIDFYGFNPVEQAEIGGK